MEKEDREKFFFLTSKIGKSTHTLPNYHSIVNVLSKLSIVWISPLNYQKMTMHPLMTKLLLLKLKILKIKK